MDAKAFVSVAILVVLIGTCKCQMDMTALLAGMNMGGIGGMGGMNMGGMGGMGGMRMGGMGGTGGMAGLAMAGSGGMSMLTGGDPARALTTATAIASVKVRDLVKSVLGPQATAPASMISYAASQLRMPSNVIEMAPYIEMMVELSKRNGIKMPDGTVQVPGSQPTNGNQKAAGRSAKKTSSPTIREVQQLVMQRSLAWYNSQKGTAMLVNSLGMNEGQLVV